MTKYYTSKYDIVFKSVFLDEENPYLLKEFLSRLLKRKVERIEFKRSEQLNEYLREKTRILDFLAVVDGEYLHIELNSSYQTYYNTRNFSYFTTVYNRHIRRGEAYDLETQFLHIDLSYGLKNNEDEYRVYNVIDKNGNKYIENFEIIEYNMDKLMKYYSKYNEEKLKEYDYLIMLDLKEKDLTKFVKGDSFMEKYKEKIDKVNEDPEFQSFMTAEEDYQKCLNTDRKIARAEGHAEGLREGQREKQIEIAKKLKSLGFTKEDISASCDLTIEEIDKL